MADDLFSQLFDLFNQPGPVNLRLAAEVARHLTGEREPVDPWTAEEFRDLARLAEYRVKEVAPFAVPPAPDVLPVDRREWAERNLDGFRYLAEPFAAMVDLEQAGPAADLLRPLGPAMAGMQLGTLVGTLAGWVMAGFDAGVPIEGDRPATFVVPTIDRFGAEHAFDPRDVRLWAALHETAHRALFRVPWAHEHLLGLLKAYADTMRMAPQRLMEMLQGMDPADLTAGGLDAERLAQAFDTPAGRVTAGELGAFLGLTAGYTRLLVARAGAGLLPRLPDLTAARDGERRLDDQASGTALAATFVDVAAIQAGEAFCAAVERRYGEEALISMWTRQGRFPAAAEIADPVAWAARVLLEDLG